MENTTIKTLPADERPREKLFSAGAGQLSNAELIAIVLGNGVGGESAIGLAGRLLSADEKGLAWLADCAPEELMKVKGVGRAKAAGIAAAAELGKRMYSAGRRETRRVRGSADAAEIFMPQMRYLKNEVFKVMMLNSKNELISVEDCALGSVNSAYITPRQVFSPAIRRGAGRIVVAHNHPSGNPEPSDNDILVTQRLHEAGQLLGIELLDHIVIGDGVYTSLIGEN